MYWRGREALDSMVINFESKLDEECALEKEGGSREDFYQFVTGSEYEIGTCGRGKLEVGFLSIFNRGRSEAPRTQKQLCCVCFSFFCSQNTINIFTMLSCFYHSRTQQILIITIISCFFGFQNTTR